MRFVVMFKPEFVAKIRDGSKPHTIRPIRKGRQIQVGDILSLRYWSGKPYGKGTTQILIREVVCTKVSGIEIALYGYGELAVPQITVHRSVLDVADSSRIAKNDGFESFGDMVRWFEQTHGLPFAGRLIEWGV